MEKFFTYIAQASSILVLIGLFVKFMLDRNNKKHEIRYNLFYTKKLECNLLFCKQILKFTENASVLWNSSMADSEFSGDNWNDFHRLYEGIGQLRIENLPLLRGKEKSLINVISQKCSSVYQCCGYTVLGQLPEEEQRDFVDIETEFHASQNEVKRLLEDFSNRI